MKSILLLLLFSIHFNSDAQNSFLTYDEEQLDLHFKAWNMVGFEMSPCFIDQIDPLINRALSDSTSLTYSWDSLENHVAIQTSSDGLFRSYSYDKRSGGNWHDYGVWLQMRTSDSVVDIYQVDTDRAAELGTYEDAGIYKIIAIQLKGQTCYLTLGYGTHGSGEHHVIAAVYGEENGQIVPLKCFDGKHLIVTTQRSHNFELEYDAKNQVLKHNEMISEEESPWNAPSGDKSIWKLEHDRFTKIK